MVKEMFHSFDHGGLTLLVTNKNGAHLMDQVSFERQVIGEYLHCFCSGDTLDDKDGGQESIYRLTPDGPPVELKVKWRRHGGQMSTSASFQLVEVDNGALVADPEQPHRPYVVNFSLPDC